MQKATSRYEAASKVMHNALDKTDLVDLQSKRLRFGRKAGQRAKRHEREHFKKVPVEVRNESLRTYFSAYLLGFFLL